MSKKTDSRSSNALASLAFLEAQLTLERMQTKPTDWVFSCHL